MLKIIPSFSYNIEIEGDTSNFQNIKNRLLSIGGKLEIERVDYFVQIVSSNRFAVSLHPFVNDLRIEVQKLDGKVLVTVIRMGEKKAGLIFFGIFSMICIAGFLQRPELKAILMPIGAYAIIYIFSFLPTHPAHAKIRKLLRHAYDEEI